jgi:hypothetical protein
MFGKAEWFQANSRGRIRPANWRGWLYSLAWGATLIAPSYMFAQLHRWPEAGIWLLTLALLWWLDVRPIRRALRKRDDVFVIDEDTDITRLSTQHYDMTLRS